MPSPVRAAHGAASIHLPSDSIGNLHDDTPPAAADLIPPASSEEVMSSRREPSLFGTAVTDAGADLQPDASDRAEDADKADERRRRRDTESAERAWTILGENPKLHRQRFDSAILNERFQNADVRRSAELRMTISRVCGRRFADERTAASEPAARVEAVARKCEAPRELGGLGIRDSAHLQRLVSRSGARQIAQTAADATLELVQNLVCATLVLGALEAAARESAAEESDALHALIACAAVAIDLLRRCCGLHWVPTLMQQSMAVRSQKATDADPATLRCQEYLECAGPIEHYVRSATEDALGTASGTLRFGVFVGTGVLQDSFWTWISQWTCYGDPRGVPTFLHAAGKATPGELSHVEMLEQSPWRSFAQQWWTSLRRQPLRENPTASMLDWVKVSAGYVGVQKCLDDPQSDFGRAGLAPLHLGVLALKFAFPSTLAQRRRLQRHVDASLAQVSPLWAVREGWRPGEKLSKPMPLTERTRPGLARAQAKPPKPTGPASEPGPGSPSPKPTSSSNDGSASNDGSFRSEPAPNTAPQTATRAHEPELRGRSGAKIKSRPAFASRPAAAASSVASQSPTRPQAQRERLERRAFRDIQDVQSELSGWGYVLRRVTGDHFVFTRGGGAGLVVAKSAIDRQDPAAVGDIFNRLQALADDGVRPRGWRGSRL